MQLPSIVRGNRYRWGVGAFLFFVGLYAATNAMHWRELDVLNPSIVDNAIPLVPGTVWIYSSYIFISLAAYVLEHDQTTLSRFLYAQLAANVFSAVIFIVWPTTFLRPELPESDGLSTLALNFVWLVDQPVNCFPSLHVSSSMLAALMMWRRRGALRVLFALWAMAIVLSTMTTKQHHVFDVLGGLVLATVLYWVFFVRLRIVQR